MPIQIIEKRKTQPQCPQAHKCLVPLTVTGLERVPDNRLDSLAKQVEAGDIIMLMPSAWMRVEGIFNCTKGVMIDRQLNEAIRCVRAYHIESVILANDDEPAPIT